MKNIKDSLFYLSIYKKTLLPGVRISNQIEKQNALTTLLTQSADNLLVFKKKSAGNVKRSRRLFSVFGKNIFI